ncbi:DUF6153 family protein [Leifsonia sp. 71-9]|uniref:DUF6153 family protein n=1 Tax=Leifsonia sp. 71-9 TaxID=1895934 RepID=UPI000928FB89|nr:DUF6153 family protein [Leifsonia sp. 71-9]OJX78863.1 MAG: hypothetical protein BGO91_12945 [Leifsonia sp. 71-9]
MVSNSLRLPRRNSWHRIAFLALGVAAIVVGLLAMHVITATSTDHTGHHTAATTHEHTDTMLMTDTSPAGAAATTHEHTDTMLMTDTSPAGAATTDCNGACESGHNMASMACLLALLITTLILTVRVIISRWGSDLYRLVAALSAALPAALAPPSPPSLLALSISRT